MTSHPRRSWIERSRVAIAIAMAAIGLGGCDEALASVPALQGEVQAAIAPHAPRAGRARPLVAVVGENTGTELADFVIPYGILKQSQAADVVTLATHPGPMQMRPALKIQPEATLEAFDARFPDGADYVIVPALGEDAVKDTRLVDWLRAQSARGATVVSICDGALVVARAGLFKGRAATGHWATQERREHEHPDTRWLKNVRYVADGKVISSAGVTAAIPLSLALVEAMAGTERAAQVAARVGVTEWSPRHDSEQFKLGAGNVATAVTNRLFTANDDIELGIEAGIDEMALALAADAFGRTYRSRVFTLAPSADAVVTRSGLAVLPDRVGPASSPSRGAPVPSIEGRAIDSLDAALTKIAAAYGPSTARLVAIQMEYPLPAGAR